MIKKPSILKLRNTKNGSGCRSKGLKTVNKNEFKKKRKKKRRKKVVCRKAEAEASRQMRARAVVTIHRRKNSRSLS